MSRLIDADALKELLYYDKATCAVIDEVPTIDHVKHGEWIADKYTRKCSECESTYWMREGNEWNYCPNCGAKNGGEDDGPV